jgi:hypothetical protein
VTGDKEEAMSKKKIRPRKKPNVVEYLSVILEPLEGKSDQEIIEWLKQKDVADVEVLAPKFISATIPADLMTAAQQVAHVSAKSTKQMR